MSEKNKLYKRVYAMLSVPAIISTVLLIAVVCVSIYLTVVGFDDPNGGGWLIFIVMLFGIVFFPGLLAWLLQAFFFFSGLKKYRKNDMKNSRTMGMVCAISSIAGNVYLAFLGFSTLFGGAGSLQKYDFALIIIAAIGIIYVGIVLGMLIAGKRSESMSTDEEYITDDFRYGR